MTSQIKGMNRLKNRRTGVLVSFTRLRQATSPTSVKTPPLASASRVGRMTRCACPTSVTMLSPPPAECPRHRLHFLDAHLSPRVLQEDLVERGVCEGDLMAGALLRVEPTQAVDGRCAPIRGVGLRVEAGCWFGQEQDSRVMHEPRAQVQSPAHPARVRVCTAVRGILQL